MTADIVFLDTETLGVDLDAPIWEVAAIRRNAETGAETELHLFVHHQTQPWLNSLPEQFAADRRARFDSDAAVIPSEAAYRVHEFLGGRPSIVGAVPNFDTERLAHQWLRPLNLDLPWHYHLIDVENLIVGYLRSARHEDDAPREQIDRLTALPWSSDLLSTAVGVDPASFDRHTAMGDVLWVRAQYDAVMGVAK